jgi:hypothetical protein
MNRRQLLVGLGGLVGGGGIITGTGAFTSVNADRDAVVAVADDASGFLQLSASPGPNGAFASQGSGEIFLDFNGSAVNGSGVGQSSTYVFRDVFRIANAGTQTVFANVGSLTVDMGNNDGTKGDEGQVAVDFFAGQPSQVIDGGDADLKLPVGQTRAIGVRIVTNEENTYGDVGFASTINNGIKETTVTADLTADSPDTIDIGSP